MNKMAILRKRWQVILVLVLFYFGGLEAQKSVTLDLGADLVSSYVWRGNKQTGLSVQPSLKADYKGISLGAWGSTDVSNGTDEGFKEVDFTLGYSIKGFNVAITDYWWDGEGAYRYFSGAREGYSGHLLEGTLGYTLPDAFPLSLTWNTFLLGKGNKKGNGDNSFSTYVELSYPFAVSGVDMSIATGFIPWTSVVYGSYADGFKVTNLTLSAQKGIRITDSFTLPIFSRLIFNPAVEDVHFVFGFTLGLNNN